MSTTCGLLILALAICQGLGAEAPGAAATVEPAAKAPLANRVDFVKQVRPILDRCQPCHFKGGTMYERYPFDTPGTVYQLGERLFTRIKDEKERAIIRAFLAQGR